MSSRFDLLTQALFRKNISECSVEQLQNLAEEYPYFAPAQFALTKKLAEEMSPAYEAQVQKAVLYYHEPLYFDHFFNEDKYYAAIPDTEIVVESDDEIEAVPEEGLPDLEEINDEKEVINEEFIVVGEEPEAINEEAGATNEQAHQPIETIETSPEIEIAEPSKNETDVSEKTLPSKALPLVDVTPEPVVFTASPITGSPAPGVHDTEVVQVADNTATDITVNDNAVNSTVTDQDTVSTETEKAAVPIEPIQAANNKEDTLPFEPYHTIDYFASQGIRLSQEEATKDSLGKQLKSFTEWLKTMKRLPVQEQIKHADPVSEQKVEHLAAHSVEGGDVLTETMAEVWIKQGNHQKAIDTYHKLSLLNPSKRAYFAAKIDSITRGN